jgi:hypothetical protein
MAANDKPNLPSSARLSTSSPDPKGAKELSTLFHFFLLTQKIMTKTVLLPLLLLLSLSLSYHCPCPCCQPQKICPFFPFNSAFFPPVDRWTPLAVQSRPNPSEKFSVPGKLKSPTRTTDGAVVIVVVIVLVVDWRTSFAVQPRPNPSKKNFLFDVII